MKLMKTKFLCGLALVALGVTSCKDNAVFDQNTYNQLVLNSFPVKNVDPAQDWTTVGTATAEVTLNGPFAYTTIKIYGENPIVIDQPTLLAKGTAGPGETFKTTFSFELAQQMVYITAVDSKGYMSVVPKEVRRRETVRVTFGLSETAASRQRVLTNDDGVPTIAYSTMEALRNTLLNGAQELTEDYADNKGDMAPLKLKISSGTWNYGCACLGDEKGRTLYIGKNVTWNIPAGTELHVGKNGIIYLDEGATINLGSRAKLISDNAGQIICMRNSEINDTNNNGEINIANGTTGDKIVYNAGTIKVGTFDNNGGYFYNANQVITNFYQSSSFNGQNVNRGSIKVNGKANMVNSALFNGCKFECTGLLTVSYVVNGPGAYISCDTYSPDGSYNNSKTHYLYLGANAIMDVKGLFDNQKGQIVISGPTTGNDYGIFQCDNIPKNTNMPLQFLNNVYGCRHKLFVDKIVRQHYHDGIYDSNYYTTENQVELLWEGCFNKNSAGNGQAKAAAYRQVNFVKDEDECSPQYVPDAPRPVTEKPLGFRFLFEDNYPDTGDYDFNDVVLKVTPEQDANNAKKVKVTVNLEATGASKNNGTAIRLKGITTGMLSQYQRTSAALPAPPSELGDYGNNIYDDDFTTSQDPNDKSSLVILLCKDVHWALNPNKGSNGGVQRFFYNTPLEGWTNYGRADVKTITYEFTFNNESDAQKLLSEATYDAFIVTSYGGGFWEVHTVQNNNKGALVLHPETHINTYQEYLNAYINDARIGNLPWAVMVPSTVAYPLEGRNIKTAYSDFEGWAQDHTTKTDWYLRPGDGHTFPLKNLYP